jgi:hypothetical protein
MIADPITAALIAAGAALVGTGLKGWTWYKDRASARATEKAVDSAVAVSATKAPFEIDAVLVSVAVTNNAGDIVTKQRVRGLNVRRGSRVRTLPSDCRTTGTFVKDKPPLLLSASRDDISFEATFRDEHQYECELRIHGELADDDPPFNYEYTFEASAGALVDHSEIKSRWGQDPLPFEFIHEIVSVPIKLLEMKVTFPMGVTLQPFPFVTYGDSPTGPREELRRVKAGFTVSQGTAMLSLNEPKVGLRYMICWDGNRYARKASGG